MKSIIQTTFVALLFAAAPATAEDSSHNVLFVGNSYTYYNNSLHNHYRKLVGEALPDLEERARILTISGGKLQEHRGLPYMLKKDGPWDVVVLQGHSLGTIENFYGFRSAAIRYARKIRAVDARPVLFMTWARTHKPEMTDIVANAYDTVGDEIGAEVAPVGLAFARVTEERPDIQLRIADRSHPTMAGTYLAASVFFGVLHKQSPEGISYDAGLGDEVASYLQRVAWETIQSRAEKAGS